jgi:hypothetical protein
MTTAGLVLCGLAALVVLFPRVLAYPMSALGAWVGLALLYRAYRLWKQRSRDDAG